MRQTIVRGSLSLVRRRGLYVAAILGALVILLEIPWSPPNHKVESDVTVYAYGGQEILRGGIPYKDFWDLKPPGVYYLYAGDFWLLGSDSWSVWYLTVLWTALTLAIFYFFMKALMRPNSALVATLVFLGLILQPSYFQGAGNPDFFGELPAIGALFLSFEYLRSPNKLKLVGLGAMLAASGLLKQTSVGTPSVCVLLILAYEALQHGIPTAARKLMYVAIPPLLGLVVVAGYWGSKGALTDLWQATIAYNFALFGGGFTLRGVYAVLRRFATAPPFVILFGLYAGTGVYLWRSRSKQLPPRGGPTDARAADFQPYWWTYAACVLSLPVEILFIASTGRDYGHYYQTAFPALCVAASFWLSGRSGALRVHSGGSTFLPAWSSLVVGCLAVWGLAVIGLLRPTLSELRQFWLTAPSRKAVHTEIGAYILANTRQDDYVLEWSISPELNFETGRRSPSRYVYDHVLLLPGFQNAQRWDEFLADLKSHPPAIIVADTRHDFAPDFSVPQNQLAKECDCAGAVLDGFRSFSEYVKKSYQPVRTFSQYLVVYKPIPR